MRIIAESDAHAASIIGIVGAHRKAGVSVTSRQLAGAFASFGRKAMLVDASRVELSDVPNPSGSVSVPALPELADEVNSAISVVDLASVTGISTVTPAELGQALKDATQSGRMIIVDLPPISLKSGLPNKATSALASACNLVFLVCLTGAMRHKQLSECVETCKVIGLELNGLILNDWSLPASHLLDR
jgi:Mrp family chromosome partitioning ATPase